MGVTRQAAIEPALRGRRLVARMWLRCRMGTNQTLRTTAREQGGGPAGLTDGGVVQEC